MNNLLTSDVVLRCVPGERGATTRGGAAGGGSGRTAEGEEHPHESRPAGDREPAGQDETRSTRRVQRPVEDTQEVPHAGSFFKKQSHLIKLMPKRFCLG